MILSSFYWGYICTQVLGGYLARVVGAKYLFAVGVGGTAALTLLNPVAARSSTELLIAVRILEGVLEGVTFPTSHYLLGNWAPKSERSFLIAFPLSGPMIGTVLSAPLTGLLCEPNFLGGWPLSFYLFGTIGVLWSLGWLFFIYDSPAKHPTISKEERDYIESHTQNPAKPVPFMQVPWLSMLLSPSVWALVIAHTSFNWNFYTLLTDLPTFLKDVLHVPSSLNGLVSALPYCCLFLTINIGAGLSDYIRKKGMSTKNVRKLCYNFGMLTSSAFIIVTSYVGCDLTIVMVLLCLSVGLSGFGLAGFITNHVDIAPQYASILMGITNTIATLPGIFSPSLTGVITNEQSDFDTWRIIFYISAGVSVFGAFVFALFGQGEVEKWALVHRKSAAIQDCDDCDESSQLLGEPQRQFLDFGHDNKGHEE